MYFIKNTIFLELTKNQKADFLSFLRNFTKKTYVNHLSEIFSKILEELEYLKLLPNPKYEYIDLENEKTLHQIELYIKKCQEFYRQKENLKPLYEAQKKIQKELRHKITEEKQKKEPPSKKQISYYKSLVKKHNLNLKDIENMSKYDIKSEINNILESIEKVYQSKN